MSDTVRGAKKTCANSIAVPIERPRANTAIATPARETARGLTQRSGEAEGYRDVNQDIGDEVLSLFDRQCQIWAIEKFPPGSLERHGAKLERHEAPVYDEQDAPGAQHHIGAPGRGESS